MYCTCGAALLMFGDSDTAVRKELRHRLCVARYEYCDSPFVTELSASDLLQRPSLLECHSEYCNPMAHSP
jgi:hypothetical protein